jgi:hypothetical protein
LTLQITDQSLEYVTAKIVFFLDRSGFNCRNFSRIQGVPVFHTANRTGVIQMALSNEEKELVEQALQVYIQVVAQQAPRQQVQQLAMVAQGIIKKLDSVGGPGAGKHGNKPAGITDEWYKHVCQSCDKLSTSGCTDKVTEKFPGKCDPILHYERDKLLSKRK